MPISPNLFRYRTAFKPSALALSPSEDDVDAAFNPDFQEQNDADPDPIPTPASPSESQVRSQVTSSPDVEASAPRNNFKGLRDLLPKLNKKVAVMPPPVAPPQAEPAPGMEDHGPAEDAAAPAPLPPPTPIAPPNPKRQAIDEVDEELKQKHASRPAAPKNNWLQNVGQAVAAVTGFGNIAKDIMHPKWSAEQRAYDASLADLQGRQKEQEVAATTQANVAAKEAQAAFRTAQASVQADAEERRQAASDERAEIAREKIAGQASKRNQDFLTHQLKGRESDSVYQAKEGTRPAGYEFIEDPEKPGFGFAVPPSWRSLTPELAPFFPGAKPGEQISHSEYKGALDAARKGMLEDRKAENKPDRENVNQWIATANDPNAPPEAIASAKAKIKAHEQTLLASRPVNNNNITVPGLGGAQNQTLSGQEFLATLPPATRAQVTQIMSGAASMPPAGARSNNAQAIRNAVFQADPNWNEQRAQLRKAFSQGPEGKNIGALNTATVHLDQLADAADALKNSSFVPGNTAYQYFQKMFGGAAPTNFEGLKSAVAGELANALKGVATDVEIRTIAHNIQAAGSPAQLKGAVTTNLHTLGAKLNTYNERFHAANPDDTAWSPVLPSARAVYQKHGVGLGGSSHAQPNSGGGNPNPSGYVKGHVYGGKTYLGGDPNKRESWQ